MPIDLGLILSEFNKERDRWFQAISEERNNHKELLNRLVDRKLVFLVNLSAISAGAIAFIFANSSCNEFNLKLAFLSFAAILFIGPLMLILSSWHDERNLPKLHEKTISVFERFRDSATNIVSRIYEGTFISEHLNSHFNLKKQIEIELKDSGKISAASIIIDIGYWACAWFYIYGVYFSASSLITCLK